MERLIFSLAVWGTFVLGTAKNGAAVPPPAVPVVEAEENVYSYEDARNGAGPMWCSGSTCLVRAGTNVFVSGLETLRGVPPLNNCRWLLLGREAQGWRRLRAAPVGLTREPCPLAVFPPDRVFLSDDPTLAPNRPAGPSRPGLLEFSTANINAPRASSFPEWRGAPEFTEYTYRSLAADGEAKELILFANAGQETNTSWGVNWSFFDRTGIWAAKGELRWPFGNNYSPPRPIRICFPNVLLRDRALHFCGVSTIAEPNAAWREFKAGLKNSGSDYDSRRLFYIFSADITTGVFQDWVEIASREQTAGRITPGDLWLDDEGTVHLVWAEQAIDERLREKFFPTAKQSHAINYARVRNGVVTLRRTLALAEEGGSQEIPSAPRFQITPEGRIFVFYFVQGRDAVGKTVSENRLLEILRDGTPTEPVTVPLQHPLNSYFTATPRAGSARSNTLDLLGLRVESPTTVSYARVRLR